nr:MAG TPA: hypothetical protein [Bacteriophage sp.]
MHTWYGAWCWKNRGYPKQHRSIIAVGSVSSVQS